MSFIVGVFSPMYGGQKVIAGAESKPLEYIGPRLSLNGIVHDRVVHQIPHQLDSSGDTFTFQVAHGHRGRTKKETRNMVGEHAIDFFRHATVETSQARF